MINITFPDGAIRQYEQGSSALDIAKQISEGLARKVLAADINGEVWDATRPIHQDASIKFLQQNNIVIKICHCVWQNLVLCTGMSNMANYMALQG